MNSRISMFVQGLQVVFHTLQEIAEVSGEEIDSVTVNVEETDLGAGVIVGNATVNNRSHPFKLSVVGNGMEVQFMNNTNKIVANPPKHIINGGSLWSLERENEKNSLRYEPEDE